MSPRAPERRRRRRGRGRGAFLPRLAVLLPRADVLILACPLTEQTRNLIDAAALAR